MHKSASFDDPLILAFLLHGAYHVCDDWFHKCVFSLVDHWSVKEVGMSVLFI